MENSRQGDNARLSANPPPAMVAILAAIFCVELMLAVACLTGQHYGSDFVEFWAASRLGLDGHATEVYNAAVLFKMEKVAVPALTNGTPWFYPPTFYATVLPFGLLPYKIAYWAFESLTLGVFLAVFRLIAKSRTAIWCVAAFPGLWINFLYGQNGFLTATLAASALLCLRRRPVLAGVFIGLLAVKPHLALLFPVALIAIGAWRALASAAITAAAFFLVSAWVMGTAALKQSYESLGHARALLEDGTCQEKMPTVFSFLRMLGMPIRAAYCIHALVALAAVAAVWKVWRCCDDWKLRGAALMTATLMVSPYMQSYDLTWLAFPILWMALLGMQGRWLKVERPVLIAAWLLPLPMAEIAVALHIQTGPWVLGGLLWVAGRRAMALGGSSQTKESVAAWKPSPLTMSRSTPAD
jgi:hypothetical protein